MMPGILLHYFLRNCVNIIHFFFVYFVPLRDEASNDGNVVLVEPFGIKIDAKHVSLVVLGKIFRSCQKKA